MGNWGVCAGHTGAVRGSVADAVKSTAAFRLFAKCGVQRLSELHRKERTALRLDWRHLPSLPCLRSAKRCDWKTGTPGTGDDSDSDGYGRSKAADVTMGCGIDIYTLILSRDMAESSKMA